MVGHNVSIMELSMSQILSSCLAIIGAMKTTPTAAVEALLGLSPLHALINKEAQAGIYALMCTQQWRPTSTKFSHTKNLRIWSKNLFYRLGLT
jgi:hypothetical protein